MTSPAGAQRTPDSLRSQVFWLLVARILGFAFTLVLPLLLVRLLDQSTYGQYRQIFVLIQTAVNILPFSVPFSAFYFFPREPERRRQVVLNIVLYHFVVSVIGFSLFLIQPRAIVWILGSEELVPYARIVGGVLFLYVFSSFLETVATAYQEVRASTVFIICANLSKSVLLLGGALLAPTVQSLVTAALLQGLLQSAVLLWYLSSRFPRFWTDFDFSFLRTQLGYALPLGVSGLLVVLQRELHFYYVSNYVGSTGYAIYSIGTFQLPLLGIIYQSIGSVLISRISILQKEGRIREIVELTAKGMRKLSITFLPTMFFLWVCSEEFIIALFTEKYRASIPVFKFNLLIIVTMIAITDPIFRAFYEHRFYIIKVRAVLLACLVVALQIFTARYGMIGAVSSVVVVLFIERIVIVRKTIRILEISRDQASLFTGNLRIAAVAVAATIPIFLWKLWLDGHSLGPWIRLASSAALYGIFYIGLLLASRTLEEDEMGIISGAVKKIRRRLPV
jgi:O-antigen/teichoic acid export membrane protein